MLQAGAPIDVERYNIGLQVTPPNERIDGSAQIEARSLLDGLTNLSIDL